MFFTGNLIKHPYFDEMRKEGKWYRVVGFRIHSWLEYIQAWRRKWLFIW